MPLFVLRTDGKARRASTGSQETYLRPTATYPSRKGRLISMKSRIGAATVLVFALGCSSAQAAPTTVDVRVEGKTRTIFEGKVTTDGHQIEQDRSGAQKCDEIGRASCRERV